MAELRPYNPTWRDKIAQALMGDGRASPERRAVVEGLTGSSGLGTKGIGILDALMVPGAVLGAQEAAQGGDYRGAAMQAMFLGPSARIADKAALAAAEKLAAKGASRDEIWNQTGWFKGVDDKWRFEVPDDKVRLDLAGRAGLGPEYGDSHYLSSVMKHPNIYDAYPELRDVNVRMQMGKGAPEGSYGEGFGNHYISAKSPTKEDMRETLLHETQHAIQGIEGFSSGATTQGPRGLTPEGYHRSAGEVEARNTGLRRNWSAADRVSTPPWATQDVPDELQIIRGLFGLGGK